MLYRAAVQAVEVCSTISDWFRIDSISLDPGPTARRGGELMAFDASFEHETYNESGRARDWGGFHTIHVV